MFTFNMDPKQYGFENPINDVKSGYDFGQGIRKDETLAEVGRRLAAGDRKGGENAAYAGGQIEVGDKVSAQSHVLDEREVQKAMRVTSALGNLALMADGKPESGHWDAAMKMFEAKGIKIPDAYRDPVNGPRMALAEAHSAKELLERAKTKAEIGQTRQQTAASAGAEGRASELHPFKVLEANAALNQPPASFQIVPEGASVMRENKRTGEAAIIHQGQQKQDATAKKAIDEADDFVAQNRSAIQSLQEAIKLNEKSYSGAGANTRAAIVNNVPFLGGTSNSVATRDLDNLVNSQALAALRSTFGGNPTEGERKILLEVAGSVNEIPAVRKKIFDRAMDAAKTRLQFNVQKSRSIRDGSYYQPGGQPGIITPTAPVAPSAPSAPAAAASPQAPQIKNDADYDALPSGTRFVSPDGKTRIKP